MPVPLTTIRHARRVVIVFVAVATTLFAIMLVVHALSPEGLGRAPTFELLAILALLTLPACTVAAWAWDRAVHRRTAALAEQLRVEAARTERVLDADLAGLDDHADHADHALRTTPRPHPHPAREHPAGRTRPNDAPAHPADRAKAP